jgi:UrcA family protein
MFRIVAAIATAAALTFSASAFAAPAANWDAQDAQQTETMNVQDVNFNNPSEVRAFYKSLRYAAARVCVDDRAGRACMNEAVSDAVRQVNQPQLSALHEKATGARGTELAMNQASR